MWRALVQVLLQPIMAPGAALKLDNELLQLEATSAMHAFVVPANVAQLAKLIKHLQVGRQPLLGPWHTQAAPCCL